MQQPTTVENNYLVCMAKEINSLSYTLEIQSILIRYQDHSIIVIILKSY